MSEWVLYLYLCGCGYKYGCLALLLSGLGGSDGVEVMGTEV